MLKVSLPKTNLRRSRNYLKANWDGRLQSQAKFARTSLNLTGMLTL